MRHNYNEHSNPTCRTDPARRVHPLFRLDCDRILIARRLAVWALTLPMTALILAGCGGNAATTAAPTTGGTTAVTTAAPTATGTMPTAATSISGYASGQTNTQNTAATSPASTSPSATNLATGSPTSIQPAASTGGQILTGPIKPADLVLTVDGQPYTMLSDSAPLLARLGSQFEMTQAESCVYEGFDKTFNYGFLEVYTIPNGKTDLLDGVYLNDDRYQTARGIQVGDPASAVIQAYGKPPASDNYCYNQSGDPANLAEPNLTFIIEGDRVTAISYYSGSNSQGTAAR